MAEYSLEQYTYKEKLRLYNSEGRENVGMNVVYDASGDYYWDTQGATLGLHTIDITTPSTEPRTICSFKDGHTYGMEWRDFNNNYSDTQYSAWVVFNIYDKDGHVVPGMGYGQTVFWDKMYNHPNASELLYSPPDFIYQLEYTGNPTNYSSGGSIITICTRPTGSVVRDMPDIRNAVTKMNGWDGAINWYGRFDFDMGYSDFNEFMNGLGPDPTPKKPEDDTNDPDPDDPEPDPDYTDPSDPVPKPDLPTGGDAISTGFIRVYAPTAGQLQTLAGKLWDDGADEFHDIITKIQNDPMEAIISLHSIPYNVIGTNAECVIGNYKSGVTMPAISTQWYTINLGSIYLPEKWASALDYSPYNQIDIFLPYIGVRSMQVDDVVGKTINVSYNTDVLSGATVASIMCGDSVLYSYNTVLTNEMPITQSSYGPMYSSILNGIGNVLSGYGAAGAPGAGASAVGSAINVAMSKQHSISRGGSIGGTYGCMGHFFPYLIIHRPVQSLASGFRHFKGYPSNITTSLGSISGYTEVESIHLDGIKCTEAERDEIRALLYNGVIF